MRFSTVWGLTLILLGLLFVIDFIDLLRAGLGLGCYGGFGGGVLFGVVGRLSALIEAQALCYREIASCSNHMFLRYDSSLPGDGLVCAWLILYMIAQHIGSRSWELPVLAVKKVWR
ncbi:hypothetical protein M0R45_005980 [Rubus argutus]|uniref:Uncharacterized protein n=1 Tax=Rubus argutus TaxID=59490 RepID=A0AAW1YP76_RUBAR